MVDKLPTYDEPSLLYDQRVAVAHCNTDQLFASVFGIGGHNGWYFADWLWRLRGFIDLCIGGVGMRRNGTNQRPAAVGDVLDFWRIETLEPGKRLVLHAEMNIPGEAWLEFLIEPGPDNTSVLTQTARFCPRGIRGVLYWYSMLPFHQVVFRGMIHAVVKKGERISS